MRIAAEQYHISRLRDVFRANRRRAAAEEQRAVKQDCEMKILDFVEKQSSPLDPQVALALARAARDTLYAESDLIRSRKEECRLMLDILDCRTEELDSHLGDANDQIAVILDTFQRRGLPFEVSSTLLERIFSTPSPLVFGNDHSLPDEGSDLDLNSTYSE